LSTAALDGLWNPFISGRLISGPQDAPILTPAWLLANGSLNAFVGQNVGSFTGVAADAPVSNAFLGGPPIDPSTGLPNAASTNRVGTVDNSQMPAQNLASPEFRRSETRHRRLSYNMALHLAVTTR
jgi:hypothetical protein